MDRMCDIKKKGVRDGYLASVNGRVKMSFAKVGRMIRGKLGTQFQ